MYDRRTLSAMNGDSRSCSATSLLPLQLRSSSSDSSLLVLCFLAALVSVLFPVAISSPSSFRLAYAHHCSALLPEPTARTVTLSILPFSSTPPIDLAYGFFAGGHALLPLEPDASVAIPRSFSLRFDAIHPTEDPTVFKIVNATLGLRGGSIQLVPTDLGEHGVQRSSATFNFLGYWSQPTGHLCAVGSGTGISEDGSILKLRAVLKLTYPPRSDLHNSLVTGVIESSDPAHSSSYFDSVSLVAYSQLDYKYSMTPQDLSSCSRMDVHHEAETLRFDGKEFCDVALNKMMLLYDLMYSSGNCANNRSCSPFSMDLGFLARSMLLNQISCSEEGKLRMFMSFLNPSNSGYPNGLVPNKTLVAEGVWDREKGRLCLVACRVVGSGDSVEKASIDDCTIRMSLWFPAVLTVRNRRSTLGRLWSDREKTNPDHFDMIALGSKDASFTNYIPGARYKYTEMATATKLCAARPRNGSLAERPFPDEHSLRALRFGVQLKGADGKIKRGDFDLLTLRGQFLSSPEFFKSFQLVGSNNGSFWDVSYSVSYFHFASERYEVPSAEGFYDAESGSLCMVACLPLVSSDIKTCSKEGKESMDCKVLMNIQVPLDAKEDERFHGSISSTRKGTDPLYFQPVQVSSYVA